MRTLAVLLISLAAAFMLTLLIVLSINPEHRQYALYYYVPITVPFVAYGLERVRHRRDMHLGQWLIDLVIVALSLIRALVAVPLISGHALFLAYALLTAPSTVVRVSSALVLLEVIYLKIFIWQDDTLIGGIALGIGAAIVFWLVRKLDVRWGEQNA